LYSFGATICHIMTWNMRQNRYRQESYCSVSGPSSWV